MKSILVLESRRVVCVRQGGRVFSSFLSISIFSSFSTGSVLCPEDLFVVIRCSRLR